MHVGDENSPANLRNTPKSMAISNFRSGSWLCENVVARRDDRIDLPSDRYSRREDSPGLSISINQRKIIFLVFEFSGFSHRLGLNQR